MIGFRAVQKLFLMLTRHHKSQLVAAALCFTIWRCQEFDSCGWRCPSSFLLLACFSIDWKSPVLSICSIRQVSHYLACLLLSTSQFSCISLELRHKIEHIFQVQPCILTWIELKIIIYLYQLTIAFLMKSCVRFVCHSLVLLDLLFTATPRPFSGWLVLSQLLPSLYQHVGLFCPWYIVLHFAELQEISVSQILGLAVSHISKLF